MDLEAKSWKASSGTALICREEDSAFFTDVVNSIGERKQLFFVELRLNGQAIAMTSNFVAGKTLFAFKVAYDPQYARFSPGLLNEFEGMRLFHDTDDLQIGESGSVQDSYIRHYWRGRADMFSVYVATPRFASSVSMSYLQAGASIRHSSTALVDRFRAYFK
jgi:CelD/BcsL family acetyltransferase involved in cellulose biosynthesis